MLKPKDRSRFATRGLRLFILAIGLIGVSPLVSDAALTVERVEWSERNATLTLTGSGTDPREEVNIRDASTQAPLGVARSNRNGDFSFTRRRIDTPPCGIILEISSGETLTADYTSTPPASCNNPDPPPDPPPTYGSHAGRAYPYEGTKTCLKCHRREAQEVYDSVHYQWKGNAAETVGLTEDPAGKMGGINDFCIYPDINWIGKLTNTEGNLVDGGCAKCHAGLGEKPNMESTADPLENIDCLLGHSKDYKRTVGTADSGAFRFVPDTAKMAVSVSQAAADIGLPTKDTCLNCHTKAGGGNNFKRGDIEETHRNPSRDFDVHMASVADGGAGLECLDCHVASSHKISGRGTDLRPREMAEQLDCSHCHSSSPHENRDIDRHTARVNCTVCHIPYFAKVAPTDMRRDWSQRGDLVPSTGLYEPHHVKGQNVAPEYAFFNGMSYFYQFGDAATPEENGKVLMSGPMGDIQDPAAKIYAFKRHEGYQPIDPVSKRLLPLKIGKFFESGNLNDAAPLGAAGVNWEYSGHDFAETERYMGLFHEVAPKEDALSCNSCHNGGSRIDFAKLGYTPDTTRNGRPLCASCHGDKSGEWSGSEYFRKLHEKHVTAKGYDCGACHTFSKAG